MAVVEFAASSHVGLVREENQDAVGKFPADVLDDGANPGLLFVIADGMGGHKGGKEASRIAVEIAGEKYFNNELASIPQRLRSTFELANASIREYGDGNPECRGMGTTMIALALHNGTAYVAHVGDSRLYKITDDEIIQLTEDHSMVAEWHRQGWLTEEQARDHPERSILYRALGVNEQVEIDLLENVTLQDGDCFLLCTDGLTNHVENREMWKLVLEENPQSACDKMIALALQRGGYDNITIQLVYYGKRVAPQTSK